MANVKIERLSLSMQGAPGQEHRIGAVAGRAANVFAARFDERLKQAGRLPATLDIGSLTAAPARVDLHLMSDNEAANAIAGAWLDAVALKLKI